MVTHPVNTTTSEPADALGRLRAMPLEALYAHAERRFRDGGGTEPVVAVVACDGARAVLKDYGAAQGWFARLIGPLLTRREVQALQRLDGIDGVPRLYRRIGRRALLIEYVPGRPWAEMRPDAHAYERLWQLMAAMHARGVAHCDLRAPSNTLVDEAGNPYLVDFVARVLRGHDWNLAWNWVFRQFRRADRNAFAKLKVRFAPELATAEDRERAVHRSRFALAMRSLGDVFRRLVRSFVRDVTR